VGVRGSVGVRRKCVEIVAIDGGRDGGWFRC
jgi:hypothetical protein